ncbi:MFS transporter [soil metagenome]
MAEPRAVPGKPGWWASSTESVSDAHHPGVGAAPTRADAAGVTQSDHVGTGLPTGREALGVVFVLYGAVSGSWAARIPWVQSALGLDPGTLGLALLAPAVGAVCTMPLVGRLVARVGSRAVVRGCVPLLAGSLALPAVMPALPPLVGALALYGAAGGALDVAANAHGVEVERRVGRPVMSGLHGMWSIGGLLGAGLAGAVAARGIGAPVHLASVAVATGLIGTAAVLRLAHPGDGAGPVPAMGLRRPSRRVLLLGLLGFCALFTEGAAADWSAVYLRSVVGTSEGMAATAFAAFSLAMAGGRLVGDRVIAALGPVRVVRTAGCLGAAGLAVALLVPSTATGLVGFALLGLGMACVVPLAFAAAGSGDATGSADTTGGRAIASVATISYLGWLLAPTSIGGLAQATSVTTALGLAVVVTALIPVLGGVLRQPR